MRDEFKHIAFDDAGSARRRLDTLLEPERPGLADNLVKALAEAADPGVVLVGLERFLESGAERGAILGLMASEPRYARMLCTIFDQSHFLTDIVCRFPDYTQWLWRDAVLDRARPRDELVGDLLEWTAASSSLEACGQAMRRFHQREILRIATRNIFVHASLASVTEDLSNLAGAELEVAVRRGQAALDSRYGTPRCVDSASVERPVSFVVIGMGKLGGHELNFSSDIDLLLLLSEEAAPGEAAPEEVAPAISRLDFFHKLGEIMIRLVSEQTGEGRLFRIDMRLRPYGRTSPLAISLGRAIEYYGGYAQAWERQALIKARPVAGDMALGKRFIAETRPFVFPRYFDDDTLNAVHQIKLQMEALIADRRETDIEVKLGRGGIRDIEFTVQMLQMLNGGRMPDLRTPNTLEAIRTLGVRGHLAPFEATTLASNYVFLREVEHRLQIEGSQQRHVLPADPRQLDRFARRLGYASGQSFMADYGDRTAETRAILDRFLSTEGAGHLWTYDLLSVHSEGAIGMARLAQFGFRDPAKARGELIQLSTGPEHEPHPFHVRQHFASIAPTLLEALGATGDPDATLVRLGRLLANLRAPGAIYETLKSNPPLCEYLVKLVDNSQYLSEILIRDPGLFDVFGFSDALDAPRTRQELEQQLDLLSRAYVAEAAPFRLRDEETLRIGMRELFRGASVVETGEELAQLAEVCVEYALAKARDEVGRRYGDATGPFAILALGRLGGREMGYGSDLDLVFVYGADAATESGMAPSEYFAALAAKTIQQLKEPTRYGNLYDVDARLRPDGKKGVLACSHQRIEQYYREEAQPWERLALTKVRAVAGDAAFGRAVEEVARETAFALPLTAETLGRIDDIRSRIVYGASPLELKKSEGGIVEIEFAVRLLQLQHAARVPELKRGDVAGALETLAAREAISAARAQTLADAYLLFRRIENRIRMMHGRSESAVPEDAAEQAALAFRLGVRDDLPAVVAEAKARVHGVYNEVLHEAAL